MTAILFTLLCIIWSSTWMAIKIGLNYFPPIMFAGIRFVIAALFLYALLKLQKRVLCLNWDKIFPAVVFGSLNGIAYGLIFWGEQYIPSSMASILNSVLPFFSAIFAYFLVGEPLSPHKIAGLLIGFSGILLIFSENIRQFSFENLAAKLAMIAASAVYAFAGAHTKRYKVDLHPLQVVTVQMTSSAIVLLLVGLPLEYNAVITFSLTGIITLLYLGIFGSAIAFLLYYNLILRMEVSKLAYTNFITPPVAIMMGSVFLNETVNTKALGGLVIIFLGLFIINYRNLVSYKPKKRIQSSV
ncbi:MAG: EamA family transporter [Firmicutes bacterium]|nr:EamA family transporter [Bacillota bacterium]